MVKMEEIFQKEKGNGLEEEAKKTWKGNIIQINYVAGVS